MKIYLVRHGQTLFNLKNRVQGWCDSALTQEGIQQALALGRGLTKIPFVAAYASTSERAMDTANYILQGRDIPVTLLKGLKEMNFGSLEGEYEEEVLASDGSSHEIGFEAFGGETILMTQKRMMTTLHEIAQQHPDGNVLVVSHGGAIMCALLGLAQVEVQEYRNRGQHIGNCSVTIVDYGDSVHLETLADTTFQEKGQKGE